MTETLTVITRQQALALGSPALVVLPLLLAELVARRIFGRPRAR